jgi:photoactive yellow protein
MTNYNKPDLEPAILEACLDQLPIGAILVDDEGVIKRFNRYEEQLSGRSREKVIGRSFFSDVAPCTNDIELGARFREGIEDGNLDIDIEFSFPYPYNRVARDVRIRATSVHGQEDHINLVLIEEITSRRELERNNQTMMASLRAMIGTDAVGDADERKPADTVTRQKAVCLLADLSSYASVAREVAPDELFGLLDGRIRHAVAAIHRYGGQIDEITGEAVRAYFVIEEREEVHNQAFFNALRAARDITGERGGAELELPFRVGIASGEVIQGRLGRDEFSQKATVGAAFTAASRLASLAGEAQTMMAADVEERVRESVGTSEVPRMPIVGLDEVWPVYRLERVDLP